MATIDHFLQAVYPITHCPNRHGLDHAGLARAFLEAGSTLFQVRVKELNDLEFYRQLLLIQELTRKSEARVIINDRADLARAAGLAGVHLGQTDLPVAAARVVLGKKAFIGRSTHTEEQFLEAMDQNIDYVAIGPIFPTSTKASEYDPVGLHLLGRLAARSRLPVVAIGGVDLDNAEQVWATGCHSVAVISDIVNAHNPVDRVREYLDRAGR